ncbi:MAG: hypothetical protein HQL03_12475, partial [Nitrospirae bacterium]|nr:hypothetical protein [Nitrospirota bacterium]
IASAARTLQGVLKGGGAAPFFSFRSNAIALGTGALAGEVKEARSVLER